MAREQVRFQQLLRNVQSPSKLSRKNELSFTTSLEIYRPVYYYI